MSRPSSFQTGGAAVTALKARLAAAGWLRATSGNVSVRLDDESLVITVSGTDKQVARDDDLLWLGPTGTIQSGTGRPSAETVIHQAVYATVPEAGAVAHVHTVFNNLVGQHEDFVTVTDHEMLKALGHWDEGGSLSLPVLPNLADLNRLAGVVARRLDPAVPGILLRRHGLYAWGPDAAAVLRHVEAWEFLFEWVYYRDLARMPSFAAP